jgi:hypothetical protein
MPKRQDIKKIMIIGSGPIVIGQACEFDYSGTQAGALAAARGIGEIRRGRSQVRSLQSYHAGIT